MTTTMTIKPKPKPKKNLKCKKNESLLCKCQDPEKATLFCEDLPSKPIPEVGKILVTGASGYIGGRLVPELVARGYKVRVLVRRAACTLQSRWPNIEVVEGDASNVDDLYRALTGINTAYYLIHSLELGPDNFQHNDLELALNFQKTASKCQVKRIIYLGGICSDEEKLSRHLKSRLDVGNILASGNAAVTTLQAAIIIGSGSASFEIIKHLIQKIPILLIPKWLNKRCTPVSIRDVIKYLVGSLETEETKNKVLQIGEMKSYTYLEILKICAEVQNYKRYFITLNCIPFKFFSYILGIITPVPLSIVSCLIEGLKNNVICTDRTILQLIPFQPTSIEVALKAALNREKLQMVTSRWSDAYHKPFRDITKLDQLKKSPQYRASATILSQKPDCMLFTGIKQIGGKQGWFHNNWMWRLRGVVDRLLLGVGTIRGRKESSSLHVDDVIDFWRVEDIEENKRLLLRAEMKLPGLAWLEFRIEPQGKKNLLSIVALFESTSIWGDIYWHFFRPFHFLIFKGLITQIEKRS